MSMSIQGLYSAAELEAVTAAEAPSDQLGKDSFLRLLTTQLQYQDPLNPMENSEFVAQLAQFSSLEQLQGLSAGMESLYLVNMSMNNASLTGLIGKDVVATGDSFHYAGSGDATLHFDAADTATVSTVTVTDADGHVVYSEDLGPLSAGEASWTWDGKDLSGQMCEEGIYSFSVSGTDANGSSVEVSEQLRGTIDGMDLSSGTPLLTVEGVPVELSSILSLEQGTP